VERRVSRTASKSASIPLTAMPKVCGLPGQCPGEGRHEAAGEGLGHRVPPGGRERAVGGPEGAGRQAAGDAGVVVGLDGGADDELAGGGVEDLPLGVGRGGFQAGVRLFKSSPVSRRISTLRPPRTSSLVLAPWALRRAQAMRAAVASASRPVTPRACRRARTWA
jgi:hypothetical protein